MVDPVDSGTRKKETFMSRRPNILFFLPDQHRRDWLGCASDLPVRTPSLDRIAQQGIRFEQAYTPSPVCSPARACLATGRDYQHSPVKSNRHSTPADLPTYYQHLRDAGYEVSSVGKLDLYKPDMDWGVDGKKRIHAYGFTRGIDNEGKGDAIVSTLKNGNIPKGPYMSFLQDRGLLETHLAMYAKQSRGPDWRSFAAVTELPDDAYCDNWVADNALRELREFDPEKPWHLQVNFVGPHDPFDVTARMREAWEQVEFPPPFRHPQPESEDVRARRQHYAAMIENIDTHVGRILREVERRGELDNTIIVYASDHGEMLGDHNRWGKSIWYSASAGIPLIISGPGVVQKQVSTALVSLHDLAATFLDWAGADPLPNSDARSIRGLMENGGNRHREVAVSALNDWCMVFDGRYKLVEKQGDPPKLFDLQTDPDEVHDIAGEHPSLVASLSSRLVA